MNFDFSSLKPLEVPVTLPAAVGNGRKDGYVLVEASEDAYRAFRTCQASGASYREDKSVSIGTGVGDSDSILLQGCLFEVQESGSRGKLSLGFIRGLGRRITEPLTKQVLQWLIDAQEAADPKASQPDTPGTST